jgi:hypothetical protein
MLLLIDIFSINKRRGYENPITSLQNKGLKFEWTLDYERSFRHLKHLLTRAPILRIADPNEDFIVCIDACKEGLGGVLN